MKLKDSGTPIEYEVVVGRCVGEGEAAPVIALGMKTAVLMPGKADLSVSPLRLATLPEHRAEGPQPTDRRMVRLLGDLREILFVGEDNLAGRRERPVTDAIAFDKICDVLVGYPRSAKHGSVHCVCAVGTRMRYSAGRRELRSESGRGAGFK